MLDMTKKFFRLGINTAKVLPLVYDDSLSYYEQLCRVIAYINEVAEQIYEQVPLLVDSRMNEWGLFDEYDSATETLTINLTRGE